MCAQEEEEAGVGEQLTISATTEERKTSPESNTWAVQLDDQVPLSTARIRSLATLIQQNVSARDQ